MKSPVRIANNLLATVAIFCLKRIRSVTQTWKIKETVRDIENIRRIAG